jgi:hypothetical protein
LALVSIIYYCLLVGVHWKDGLPGLKDLATLIVKAGTPSETARNSEADKRVMLPDDVQRELDTFRARLAELWNPPAGAKSPAELIVQVRMKLNRDGSLAGSPIVLTRGTSPLFVASRDSAVRAIVSGQPFKMLSPSTYNLWKDIEVTFDPHDIIRH